MHVLVHDEADEGLVVVLVVEGEGDQLAQRVFGARSSRCSSASMARCAGGRFENGDVERLLFSKW
jgi:hypothetical protein